MSEKATKVLYLFAGERKVLEAGWRAGKMPDTHLIGFNHLAEFGVEADFVENRFLNWVRKRNYNIPQIFLLPFLARYDVVFSGASLALPFIAKVVLRMRRPKFVWYNTFFTNAIKRNRTRRFRLWAIRKTIASLDAIVCPSTAQREFLIKEGFDARKIFFVPNGVDAEFIDKVSAARPEAAPPPPPFILSVGKDMGRDYKTLFAAVADLPVQVRVAALPRNLKNAGPAPLNVKAEGFVPFGRLAELYEEARFVVISTKSENHLDASDCSGQYVLLDAMSAGKAVIASERATLADYVSNGKEGLIVPPENSSALRTAIKDLLDHPDKTDFLGKAGREKVVENFTTTRLARDLADIFKKVVS